jgi:hypothetical protein
LRRARERVREGGRKFEGMDLLRVTRGNWESEFEVNGLERERVFTSLMMMF